MRYATTAVGSTPDMLLHCLAQRTIAIVLLFWFVNSLSHVLLGAPAQFAACGFLFFLPLTADVFFLTNQIARFREISANQIARFRRDEILSSESPYNPPSLEVTCTGEIVEAASSK